MVVVLPAPLAPSRPTTSCSPMVKLTPSTAVVGPRRRLGKTLVRPSTSSMGFIPIGPASPSTTPVLSYPLSNERECVESHLVHRRSGRGQAPHESEGAELHRPVPGRSAHADHRGRGARRRTEHDRLLDPSPPHFRPH